jgi:NAD(P)-dependent dehydrogenase (short-subunit alcohol dehydrogenase family)
MTEPTTDAGNRFAGRRAILTGAGSGIGRATALRLAAEGAAVACLDIAGADTTAAEVADAGGRAIAVTCDVSDAAGVADAVARSVDFLGGVDTLGNIAGIGHFVWTHQEDPADFDRIMAVNLNGQFYLCRYVLPHMVEAGRGVIVNIASTAGLIGQSWSAAYAASKGGVVMLTKALAYEYRTMGIRVNAIAPGFTNTNIIHSFLEVPEGGNPRDLHKISTPMGSGEPDEVAALIAYVASDAARFMTGAIIPLDGGITC